MSRLWLSLFFIPQTFISNKQYKKLNWIPLALCVGALVVIAQCLLAFPNSFPDIKYENGQDTYFAIIVKVITINFLVITVVRYYEGWKVFHNTALMSFIVGGALIVQTPIIFMLSKPWGQAWWFAHNVYLLSFIIIGLGLVYSFKYQQIEFFNVSSQVEEYVKTIKSQKIEMEHINERLTAANTQLMNIAYTDQLTGAFNRRHFEQIALVEIEKARRYGQKNSLLLIDIDHFKSINDDCGHNVGDQVLINLVRLITKNIRVSDVLARWGGEEFVVLAPALSAKEALQFAQKIRMATEEAIFIPDRCLTISIGVAELHPAETLDSWFIRADKALYAAKDAGRNKVISLESR